jgi:hypothetical protein
MAIKQFLNSGKAVMGLKGGESKSDLPWKRIPGLSG